MKEILRFWRDLSQESKDELKSKHNIQTVTYSFIKMVWKEMNKNVK